MVYEGVGWSQFVDSFWNIFQRHSNLGKVWDSITAHDAFEKGELRSVDAGSKVRIAFRNCSPDPLILCWVDNKGTPQHFYTLPPIPFDDGPISLLDHIEHSSVGHAFCLAECDDLEFSKANKKLDRVVCGYRPTREDDEEDEEDQPCIHLLRISQAKGGSCCGPSKAYDIKVQRGEVDCTPIDTSKKLYEHDILGGWPVRVEKGWYGRNLKLKSLFEEHLKIAAQCLPPHAREELRKTTPFFINKSLSYGPKVSPIRGHGMCFHPEVSWLEQNGMCKEKCECVEIYECEEYLDDCNLWGPGGVLLHELCHAYHWKMVPDGYDNPDIIECYKMAMKEGRYNSVKVHGPQGPTARAYACENAMEYFAELSVAFLAGRDKNIEYNKWQPFNRCELKKFDPRAYNLLKKIWRMEDLDDADSE